MKLMFDLPEKEAQLFLAASDPSEKRMYCLPFNIEGKKFVNDGYMVFTDQFIYKILHGEVVAKYAFANQNITSVHIPDSVTAIGFRAFSGCHRLMQVRLPARLSKLEDSVFENCSSLTRLALPQSLKTIGSYAFSGCTALSELRNTAQLPMIDRLAFYHCHALREVALTPGTRLGQDAFPTTTKLVKAIK